MVVATHRSEGRGERRGVLPRAELRDIIVPSEEEHRGRLRGSYRAWLDRIDDELIGGALLVSEAVPRVTRAFLRADRSCIDITQATATEVDERVRHVEQEGFLLLAREAPVAGDLRRLVAILRLVTAVERPAALLRHVAETLDRVDPRTFSIPLQRQADELGSRAGEVYRRGVDAWRTRDGLAVHELTAADSAVDRLSLGLLAHAEQVGGTEEALVLGLLGRYWERIGDHGVSFAQHSTFAVTGERVEVGP
jgi:phosphate transport system protein